MEILILVSVIAVAVIAIKIFANRETYVAPPPGDPTNVDEEKPTRAEINDRR